MTCAVLWVCSIQVYVRGLWPSLNAPRHAFYVNMCVLEQVERNSHAGTESTLWWCYVGFVGGALKGVGRDRYLVAHLLTCEEWCMWIVDWGLCNIKIGSAESNTKTYHWPGKALVRPTSYIVRFPPSFARRWNTIHFNFDTAHTRV